MAKQILTSWKARRKVLIGVNKMANLAKVTLGPKGRNVLIEKEWGESESTQDGVTVARSASYSDKFENLGAQFIKNAAIKTNDEAGDATTATMVLSQEISRRGNRYYNLKMLLSLFTFNKKGMGILGLRKGMKLAVKAITDELTKMSVEIKDKEQMKQIATISAKDENIGIIVSDIMDKVGKAGVINVEKGQTNDIQQEIVEGFRFDKGFISPYMTTDKAKGIAEYDNPLILITDKAISDVNAIIPIMEKLAQGGVKQLVTISGDMGGDALMTLVVNNAKGSYRSLAIKAPYYGDKQKATLEDIAILTGGVLVTQDIGLELKDVEIVHLGRAKKIFSTKDHTTIIGGEGDKEIVKKRISEIQDQIIEEKSDYLKEILRERLGRLSGVVGVIKIGANSDVEQRDLELRIEDAISATQAALEEGIVLGGGLALIRAREKALEYKPVDLTKEETKGWEIVMEAVKKPFCQILLNAGENPKAILNKLNQLREENSKADGYNADTGEYVDMLSAGVIDSKKAIRCALKNASSAAEMILSTEGVVCLDAEPKTRLE